MTERAESVIPNIIPAHHSTWDQELQQKYALYVASSEGIDAIGARDMVIIEDLNRKMFAEVGQRVKIQRRSCQLDTVVGKPYGSVFTVEHDGSIAFRQDVEWVAIVEDSTMSG